MLRTSSLLFSVAVVTACGGTEPGTTGDDDPQVDAPVAPTGCSTAADCGAESPICDPNGVCVQCMTSADCPSDKPICGGSTCEASCAGEEVNASFVTVPSDIIWVVDQSGSMNQETAHVQSQINNFVDIIAASSIDYRVVMIARSTGTNKICVPGPLGGTNCGNNTNFRLVNQVIGSHDALAKTLSTYSQYSDFLRENSMKHFVFVTDDNATGTVASNFVTGLDALQPTGMFANRKFHAIYAFGNGLSTGCTGAFGTGAAEGTQYTTLVTNSGGARGVICNDDWTQVFDDITQAVISGSQVSCSMNVPAAPEGQTLDPNRVNVKYLEGGVGPGTALPKVNAAADCTASGGWYYDDNTAPTTITLCPTTCTTVQNDTAANVKLELGCATNLF